MFRTKCENRRLKKRLKNQRYYLRHRKKILKKCSEYQRKKRKFTNEELEKMKRNEKGQFLLTTGSERYKNVRYLGRNMGEHRKVWIQNHGKIPKGHIIYHLDGNKLNNNLDNLKAISRAELLKLNRSNSACSSQQLNNT